ncbi:hypothetical protein PV326_000161, partial [Microctonus aethiopoides]
MCPIKYELKKRLAELEKKIKAPTGSPLDYKIPSTSLTVTPEAKRKINNQQNSATESDFEVEKSLRIDFDDWRNNSESENSHAKDSITSLDDDNDEENSASARKSFEKSDPKNVIIEDFIDDYNDPDLYGKDWSGEK